MTLDLPFFAVCIGIVLMAIILNRRYNISAVWITTIKRFAPLWLIFLPAIITYLFVCGAFSALMVAIYISVRGKENFNADEFLLMEKTVEYICSFFMPLLYFKILKKNLFPFFWTIVITLVHMIVAGYRDAKLILFPHTNGNEPSFESGPQILQNFQLSDAIVPLLSFLIFYLLRDKKWKIIASKAVSQKTNTSLDN